MKTTIIKYEGFLVVRDDLVEGGTKRRVLERILPSLSETEIVYPAHAYGYAGYALGLAAQECGKKVRLFFPSPRVDIPIFEKTIGLSDLSYSVESVYLQKDLVPIAKRYSSKSSNRYLMPIGFNTQQFFEELVRFILSLDLAPKEVWCLAGSGLLCRALCRAWPNAQINAVSMGFPQMQVDQNKVQVFETPEPPEETAKFLPPYPSAEYYDAKIWQLAKKFGSEGALIWNVA